MNRWLGLSFRYAACSALSLPAWLSPCAARAQTSGYSALEQSVVSQDLAERGLQIDPQPEGKRIESVQIVTRDVFDERDPVPDLVNFLHATTRRNVIARELLFAPGDAYRSAVAQESARNLRAVPQLSIVLVVPTRGRTPDRVQVLVITKDVWSLRLNWQAQLENSHLTSLVLNPSEENLFGTHATVGAVFALDPAAYSLGLALSHRRLLGSHQLIWISANVVRNRDTGNAEGSFGEFRYGQPLYSLDTKWSWGTSVLWRHDIARNFTGVNLNTYAGIPMTYDRDALYGGYEIVRSYGKRLKYDLSFGVEAVRRIARARDLSSVYPPPGGARVPDEFDKLAAADADRARDVAGYSPAAVARFLNNWLPVSEQRISPFVQLHAHRTDYSSLIEVETLGLQEDIRRGHDLLLRIFAASSAVGSTRSLVGTLAALSYTFPIADGFLRPLVGARFESATQGRDDAVLEGRLRFVSPRLGFGRLLLDGQFEDSVRNYLRHQFVVGGDNRLRGYASGKRFGPNLVAATAELRTTSFDLLSAQVGAAAFYDVADAPVDFQQVHLLQGAGVGVRVLFPEFDRIVFRADWGFPLTPGYPTFPGTFFFSAKQAFDLPGVGAPSVLTQTL